MEDKQILLNNIEKIHTTKTGVERIKKNLKLETDHVIEFFKNKIIGKNCYCELGKTSIDNIISKLKKLGYIERVGSNKTGYWKVIE